MSISGRGMMGGKAPSKSYLTCNNFIIGLFKVACNYLKALWQTPNLPFAEDWNWFTIKSNLRGTISQEPFTGGRGLMGKKDPIKSSWNCNNDVLMHVHSLRLVSTFYLYFTFFYSYFNQNWYGLHCQYMYVHCSHYIAINYLWGMFFSSSSSVHGWVH